jgi:hypothetical protein
MVQSFNHECLKEFERVRIEGQDTIINTVYLQNFDTYIPETHTSDMDISHDLLIQKDKYGTGSHF